MSRAPNPIFIRVRIVTTPADTLDVGRARVSAVLDMPAVFRMVFKCWGSGRTQSDAEVAAIAAVLKRAQAYIARQLGAQYEVDPGYNWEQIVEGHA